MNVLKEVRKKFSSKEAKASKDRQGRMHRFRENNPFSDLPNIIVPYEIQDDITKKANNLTTHRSGYSEDFKKFVEDDLGEENDDDIVAFDSTSSPSSMSFSRMSRQTSEFQPSDAVNSLDF